MSPKSPLAVYALLAVLIAFALAAVLLIPAGPEANQRLGLFFGALGVGIAAVVGLIKADQAAHNTNGALDGRIEAALLRAQSSRRRSDIVPDSVSGTIAADDHTA